MLLTLGWCDGVLGFWGLAWEASHNKREVVSGIFTYFLHAPPQVLRN